MMKIPCLFKRVFYENEVVLTDVVTPGCEWVLNGEGEASVKIDGTACAIIDGKLYARYDCKPTKQAQKNHKQGEVWNVEDFREPPQNSIPCQEPDIVTGHWPHWVLVEDQPEYKYHREAVEGIDLSRVNDATYELIGPKIGGNPENSPVHSLIKHGLEKVNIPVRTFETIREWLAQNEVEGLVFKHSDGRMCKIRRRDYGLEWPIRRNNV